MMVLKWLRESRVFGRRTVPLHSTLKPWQHTSGVFAMSLIAQARRNTIVESTAGAPMVIFPALDNNVD